jgi:hypothetical protein
MKNYCSIDEDNTIFHYNTPLQLGWTEQNVAGSHPGGQGVCRIVLLEPSGVGQQPKVSC